MTKEVQSTQGGAEVRLDRVRFAYGDFAVQFDATFASGSITAVMGPSGSGKSTLLSLVAGFETPSAGRILIGGADVTGADPHARPVSMVFQENNLFAHLNVAANVGLGISPGLKLTDEDRAAVSGALEKTGLSGKERRLPNELSGGERQRVALARVLVRKRPVLLLDEPFASLGPALRREMLDLVATLHREQAMTILFVTHQPDDARRLAGNTLFLENGAIVAAGETSIVFGDHGPDVIKRYIGSDFDKGCMDDAARKPT